MLLSDNALVISIRGGCWLVSSDVLSVRGKTDAERNEALFRTWTAGVGWCLR